jgi:hypothetical protein
MKLIRLVAAAVAATAALLLRRHRTGWLRLDRAHAALRLAARGGAHYAGSAPRLFAAACERRQQLREDLALQTAEDVVETLRAMKGLISVPGDADRAGGQRDSCRTHRLGLAERAKSPMRVSS